MVWRVLFGWSTKKSELVRVLFANNNGLIRNESMGPKKYTSFREFEYKNGKSWCNVTRGSKCNVLSGLLEP